MLARALLATLLLAGPAHAQPEAAEAALREHGCLGCHSTDGSAGPGPTLAGIAGRARRVVAGGEEREVVADDAYLARSIREPDADVVVGHGAGRMPALPLDDAAVARLVDAMRELPAADPPAQTLVPLAIGTLGFLLMHLLLSFHPIRSRLVARLGDRRFQGLYSLIVLIPFVLIFVGWLYRPFVPLWDPAPWTRWVPLVVMPVSFVLVVAGYTTRNPATAGQQDALGQPLPGILTITRHPALVGYALWAASHLPPNGDLASVLLFGSFFLLATLGAVHIDARRRRELGPAWDAVVAQTSIVPFAAIARGRVRPNARGLGVRTLAGLLAYVAMLLLHEWEIGVSPFP